MRTTHLLSRTWPALACTALLACASPTMPVTELAMAQASIAHAQAAGAGQWAPAELQASRLKFDGANQAVTSQNATLAQTLAVEANADAQVAEARTESVKATRAADALRENLRVLREELARKTK